MLVYSSWSFELLSAVSNLHCSAPSSFDGLNKTARNVQFLSLSGGHNCISIFVCRTWENFRFAALSPVMPDSYVNFKVSEDTDCCQNWLCWLGFYFEAIFYCMRLSTSNLKMLRRKFLFLNLSWQIARHHFSLFLFLPFDSSWRGQVVWSLMDDMWCVPHLIFSLIVVACGIRR